MNEIKKILLELGISPELNGFFYLAESINTTKGNIEQNKFYESYTLLYEEIARKFNTKGSRVERTMRHAIEKAFTYNSPLLQEIFKGLMDPCTGKVTVSCFIATLAQWVIISENEQNELRTVK